MIDVNNSDTPQKTCTCCGRPWPTGAFTAANGRDTKYCASCREVRRDSNRAHRRRIGSAGTRAAHLWQKYRITPEEYDELREAQGYRCAICGTHEDHVNGPQGRSRLDGTPTATAFPLVVDHCHTTGTVRGLLCGGCNSALGHFGDRIESLNSAVRYLRAAAAAAAPRVALGTSRLRLIDPAPNGRPTRTVRIRGATTIHIRHLRGHAASYTITVIMVLWRFVRFWSALLITGLPVMAIR
jgi:hypothetical protein